MGWNQAKEGGEREKRKRAWGLDMKVVGKHRDGMLKTELSM